MSQKNPGSDEAPPVVLATARILEQKLGRPSAVRQVKNQRAWWITDPMFSFVQHGLRTGATGYRVGYRYTGEHDAIYFELVHSPVMARLFKKNLNLQTLIRAVAATAGLRSASFLLWSSRSARKKGLKWNSIDCLDVAQFLTELREFDRHTGFARDLFPSIENQKTGMGPAKWAGNDFRLLLAERVSTASRKKLMAMLEATWPLFLCLYPIQALEQRVASLARNLNAASLPKACEYRLIKSVPRNLHISPCCRGEIEGAHIKPHSKGGSDRLENGIWLCQYHHRQTEGRLRGTRTRSTAAIRFEPDCPVASFS